MASTSTGLNGAGIGVAAAGGLLIYAAINNVPILDALRSLAKGKAPTPNPKAPFTGVTSGTGAPTTGDIAAGDAATGARIVALAASKKGQCYSFGQGHTGNACASKCTDCSSYVSCVLNRAGQLKGTLATWGLSSWGVSVPFGSRGAGDVLVWNGGAGNGHCGIVIDASTMWHNPCTKCGGVQIGKYGSTRTGRPTIVRRARAGLNQTVPQSA